MKNRIIVFATSLFLFSCSSTYNKEDAVRSLKVLNSDIVNFLNVSSELPEFQAIKFLYNQANSPIPFKKSKFKLDNSAFNMENERGTYIWNPELNDFDFKKDKDFIDVRFQLANTENIFFQILNYESVAYSSKPDFPTKIIAKIHDGTNEKLVINHVGKVEDNLPESMETTIKGDGYDLNIRFKRTRNFENGTIAIYCTINKGIITLIDSKLLAKINYSQQGFYYKNIEFESQIFNHTIRGVIDYEHIEPTSTSYAKSFNENAKIELFESSNIKVGDIILASSGVNDLQEFKIEFENKDRVLLKEYLPALDKMYNLKY